MFPCEESQFLSWSKISVCSLIVSMRQSLFRIITSTTYEASLSSNQSVLRISRMWLNCLYSWICSRTQLALSFKRSSVGFPTHSVPPTGQVIFVHDIIDIRWVCGPWHEFRNSLSSHSSRFVELLQTLSARVNCHFRWQLQPNNDLFRIPIHVVVYHVKQQLFFGLFKGR